MPSPQRYILPFERTGPEIFPIALEKALSILGGTVGGSNQIILLTPVKDNLQHIQPGESISRTDLKALHKGETIKIGPTVTLRHATLRTIGLSAKDAVVIVYFVNDKELEKLDGLSALTGLIVVPDPIAQVQDWQTRWTVQVHGQSASAPVKLIPDPITEKALVSLTSIVNRSRVSFHPSDKQHAQNALKKLHDDGQTLDDNAIKSWAIQQDWNPELAEELGKLAARVAKSKR